MIIPSVYLFELAPSDKFEIYVVGTGNSSLLFLTCSICHEQHQPTTPLSNGACPVPLHPMPSDHYTIRLDRASRDIVEVPNDQWMTKATDQITGIVNKGVSGSIWSGRDDVGIFVLKQELSTGRCLVGSFGRVGSAPGRSTKLFDYLYARYRNLEAFW